MNEKSCAIRLKGYLRHGNLLIYTKYRGRFPYLQDASALENPGCTRN